MSMQWVVRALLTMTAIALSLGLTGCAEKPTAPLATVKSVDLLLFNSNWYEIALLPNRYQQVCATDTMTNFREDDGGIRVRTLCRSAKGKVEEITGIAKIVENSGNAKMRLSFMRPFYQDFWILALDSKYQWVLIGEPTREYGWILSSSPVLNNETLQNILDQAVSLGYKREAFQRSPQPDPIE